MPNDFESVLAQLAATFASNVVAAIRAASVEDVLTAADGTARIASHSSNEAPRRGRPRKAGAPTPLPAKAAPVTPLHALAAPRPKASKGERLARRSLSEIAGALGQVTGLLKKHPKGLRAEQIRTQLDMLAKEMPRVLKEGLAKKTLKSKGQKRATTYTAA